MVTWLLFCFYFFPGLQGMVQTTMTIIIIIIIIILIIVTCIHSIFVERQQEQVPLIIIKVPIPPITSDERVYMLTFIYEFNKMELYQ